MWSAFNILVAIAIMSFDILGPVVVLLYVKRRSGSWRRAACYCAITATVCAFIVSGTLCWIQAALRELIYGPTGSTALMTAFPAGGIYGALFAMTFLLLALPVLRLWRLIHPRSFQFITTPGVLASLHEEGMSG